MGRDHNYYVYILASENRTLYIGVTNNLIRRVEEHKDSLVDGFTKQYKINKLVYYEWHTDINYAIQREKQLKNWHRKWKVDLVEKDNRLWNDLYKTLIGEDPESSSG